MGKIGPILSVHQWMDTLLSSAPMDETSPGPLQQWMDTQCTNPWMMLHRPAHIWTSWWTPGAPMDGWMPTMCTNGWENPNKLVVDERQFHFSFLASLCFSVSVSLVLLCCSELGLGFWYCGSLSCSGGDGSAGSGGERRASSSSGGRCWNREAEWR